MLCCLILAILTSSAAPGPAGVRRTRVVSVHPPEDFLLAPGESAVAGIRIRIAEGFHVQANPAAKEFLIPLTVELEGDEHVRVGQPRYPKGGTYLLKGSDDPLLTYEGILTVSVPVRAPMAIDRQETVVSGRVRYQACDESSCRPPASVEFDLKVRFRADRKRKRQ